MDNIQKLIEALRDVEADFTALGQSRAFQGIVLTFANTLKPRASEFQELLPKAATGRRINRPVQIKSLSSTGVGSQQTTHCPTCGKGSSVPPSKNTYVSGGILRLTQKAEETSLPIPLQEAEDVMGDFIAKVGEGFGLTMEEAGKALSDPSETVITSTSTEVSEGIGVSPVYFENPENILTGEPVIESTQWAAVLQEVKDVKQAKELYRTITGKGYPPRWPQELDQIAKAIWEARENIEI